jgi:hypothetical protein
VARPYQIVDLPTSTVLPYGLLSVVEPLNVTSDHWQNGVTWQSRCPDSTITYDECIAVTGVGAPPPQPGKIETVTKEMRAATPFTPYLELDCSPVGLGDVASYVSSTYDLVAPEAVERGLWTGLAGNGASIAYPHLAAASEVADVDGNMLQTVPVTGGPFNPADALGFLEAQMALCLGTIGVIHIPRRALAAFTVLLTSNAGRLRTTGGNLVAAGSGYPGTSPAGAAPAASQAWIYGTGQIFGKWGDIRVTDMPGSFDRAKNTRKMIAERTYLLGWDCCHVGVLVDLSAVV